MHLTRLLVALLIGIGLVAACGADTDDRSSNGATATPVTAAPTSSATAPTSEAPAPSSEAPTTEGDAPDGDLVEITVGIPTGSLEFGPDDVIVAEAGGDLVVYRGLLAGDAAGSELLADYPDPTGPVTEGPGPNVVDDVAGVVDGTLIFGDCCEPISGNVLIAVGDPADVRPVSPGYGPTLSPDRSRLASASSAAIQWSSTIDGVGVARLLNQGDRPDGFLNVDDVAWAGDTELVLVGWDDAGYAMFPVDAATLALGDPVRLDIDAGRFPLVRFAGRSPDGLIALSVEDTDRTELRYFRTDDLVEDEPRRSSFGPDVTSPQRGPDGIGLLWVTDGALWWLPGHETGNDQASLADPVRLADGVSAAWIVEP